MRKPPNYLFRCLLLTVLFLVVVLFINGLASFPARAFGSVTPSQDMVWRYGGFYPSPSPQEATRAAAFEFVASCGAATPCSPPSISCTLAQVSNTGNCSWTATQSVYGTTINIGGSNAVVGTVEPHCPDYAGSTGSGAIACSCWSGYKPNSSRSGCDALDCATVSADLVGAGYRYPGRGSSFCAAGCSFSPGLRGYLSSTNTTTVPAGHVGPSTGPCSAGVDSSSGNTPGSGRPAVSCPVGQCSGSVNGTDICVDCSTGAGESSSSASAPSTGASGASPSPSAPSLGGNAPPGAASSDTSSECTGSRCTTTINYRDALGNIIGTSQTAQDKGSFCSDNPGLTICKTSTYSGACSQVACEGDAVQCAIAKEQARRNCELWDSASSDHPGVRAANGQDHPEGHPYNNIPDTPIVAGNMISDLNNIGGGCPGDVSVSVMGHGLSLPFSSMCPHLRALGYVLQGSCMLVAALIVFRRS